MGYLIFIIKLFLSQQADGFYDLVVNLIVIDDVRRLITGLLIRVQFNLAYSFSLQVGGLNITGPEINAGINHFFVHIQCSTSALLKLQNDRQSFAHLTGRPDGLRLHQYNRDNKAVVQSLPPACHLRDFSSAAAGFP